MVLWAFIAIQSTTNADNVTGYMLEQWAEQATAVIDDDCRLSSGLYGQSATSTYPEFAWGQGVMLGANNAAAKVDSSYISRATLQARRIYDGYRCYYNGIWGYNAAINSCGDRYYDDNAWLALTFLDLAELTGNNTWLTRAQEIIAFCMSGENATGGIRWHESNTGGVSVCASAPTILANFIAFEQCGVQSYFDDGLRVYRFLMDDSGLLSDSGCFHENAQGVLGYLSAVMTRAALRLYHITGDESYLAEARMMAVGLEFVFINHTNGSLGQYGKWGGHDMTDAFVEMYETTGEEHWLNLAAGMLEFMYVNCQDPATGRYPAYWNDNSMENITSSLIENASVAKALWTLARTQGGVTTSNHFTNEMVGRWKLNETTGAGAWDSSANSNIAELSGFTFDSSAANGPCEGALTLDGVDDHLALSTDCSNFRNGITLSIWAFPTAATNWARFFDIGNGEYDNNIVFARQGTTTTLSFEAYKNSTSGGRITSAGAIELNKWQLFTATIDAAGNAAIYKNGSQLASGKTAIPPNIERLYKYVGRSNWEADLYYQGSIDDVRIYNYALSAGDVAALYIGGGQAENPVPLMDAVDVSSGAQMSWHAGSLADGHDVYIGTDSAAVSEATANSDEYVGRQHTNKLYYPLAPGTTYYWRVDEAYGAEIYKGRVWSFTTAAEPAEKILAYYRADFTEAFNSKTLIDTSVSDVCMGAEEAGILHYIEELYFPGDEGYLDVPPINEDFSQGFTVNLRAKPTAAQSWARFVDFGNGAGVDNIVFAREGTTNTLYITAFNGTNGGERVSASGALALDTWQMLSAVIYPSGYAVIYINGELVGKGVTTCPSSVIRRSNYIGKSNWDSDAYYKGSMDDISFWARALSPEEVRATYNRLIDGEHTVSRPEPSETAGHWSFNDRDSLAADSSAFERDGSLVNMWKSNQTTGKECGGLIFNGTNQYVSIDNFRGIAGEASRTCCAWIKTNKVGKEIISWGYPDAGQKWVVRIGDLGTLRVEVGSGYVFGTTYLHDGNWHHIAVSLGNFYESEGNPKVEDCKLYVDGEPELIAPYKSQIVDTVPYGEVTIGVFGAVQERFFEGTIDEVMLFDRELSAEEIYDIYASSALAADIDENGAVDMADFSLLGASWLTVLESPSDITCDCLYDIDDMAVLADEWLGEI
jgi:hypothetical protein